MSIKMSKTIKRSTSSLSCKKKSGKNDTNGSKIWESKPPSDFVQLFQDKILDECGQMPIIQTEHKTLFYGNDRLPVFTIGFENKDILKKIYCKGANMDAFIFPALMEILPSFGSLTEIKFEFCNLAEHHLKGLHSILKKNPNITYASLNGNEIPSQNYFLLLAETSLKILSLQFCQISEAGAGLLGRQLAKPDGQTLVYLNVASNHLEDDGLLALSYGLRGNRTLAALNVADNRLTEKGITEFLNIFQRFPLNHEEIVYRRQQNLEFLRLRETMRNNLKAKLSSRGSSKKYSESSIRKKVSSAETMSRRSAVNSNTTSMSGINKKKESELENSLTTSTHPFVCESHPDNKEIFCIGNNSLLHLNLSYNEINENILNKLTEVVCYQKQNFQNMKKSSNVGLTRIIFAGKDADNLKAAIAEFYSLLYSTIPCNNKMGSRSSSTIASKQRSMQLKSA